MDFLASSMSETCVTFILLADPSRSHRSYARSRLISILCTILVASTDLGRRIVRSYDPNRDFDNYDVNIYLGLNHQLKLLIEMVS